jgi:hypothetical protein
VRPAFQLQKACGDPHAAPWIASEKLVGSSRLRGYPSVGRAAAGPAACRLRPPGRPPAGSTVTNGSGASFRHARRFVGRGRPAAWWFARPFRCRVNRHERMVADRLRAIYGVNDWDAGSGPAPASSAVPTLPSNVERRCMRLLLTRDPRHFRPNASRREMSMWNWTFVSTASAPPHSATR